MSIKKPFYPFVLDHKPGFLLNWFLYTLFKRVQFNENMIDDLKEMHRKGTVVYAIKYRGHLDYLLYHYRFRRSRLPYPKISFDQNMSMFLPLSNLFKVLKFYIAYFIKHWRFPNPFESGFFRDSIKQGTASLFCLVDPKRFARHFIHSEKDSLHFLLETQKDMESAIYIIPQLILYKKTPEKEYSSFRDIFFGFKERPGVIRKIVLFFRHNRRAFIDFGKPLNLKAYLKKQPASRSMEEMATEIRQMLIESIDMQKRVIIGPVMKSRQQFKEIVLKDEEIASTIEDMAAGNANQLKQLRKKAGEYFDEIAADYNIAFGLVGVLWLIANLTFLLTEEDIIRPWVLFAVIGFSGIILLVIYTVGQKLHATFLTEPLNLSVLAAHLLDAASSYIGIDILDYSGKHVIEGIIVKYTGSAVGMFALKLGILIPVLYLLDTQFDDKDTELRNLVLLALIVIGLAPAVRNTLRMILGV